MSDPDAAPAADADHDVCMMMAFQAGEAARFEFEITHMEPDLLATVSNQDLA